MIDNDTRGGHDDPQHFEVAEFAQALDGLLERLSGQAEHAEPHLEAHHGAAHHGEALGDEQATAPAEGAEQRP